MNLCLRKCFKPPLVQHLFKYSTSTISEVSEDLEPTLIDEDLQKREAELEKKRNKSGLTKAHFNLVNGKIPYETPQALFHNTVKYHRKLYGTYGASSGVNPNICWPSKKDIAERKEYESVAFPFTIPEMIAQAAAKRKAEHETIIAREKDISAKLEKLEQWKKDLNSRIHKKTEEARIAKEKKERLVEEVRRHFGFKLNPRDERFQEMLAKREKEQKKQEKLAKREAKEKLMLAKLQQKNVELTNKAE